MVFSSSFWTIQVKSSNFAAVVKAMRAAGVVPAYVCEPVNDWISIFPKDKTSTAFDAEKLSQHIDTPVFSMNCFDSDVMDYHAFESGVQKDEFESDPGYGTISTKPPSGGNIDYIMALAVPGTTVECVENIFAGRIQAALEELGLAEMGEGAAAIEAAGVSMIQENLKGASLAQKALWGGIMLLGKLNKNSAKKKGFDAPAYGGDLYGQAIAKVLGISDAQLAEYADFQCFGCMDDDDKLCDHRTAEGKGKRAETIHAAEKDEAEDDDDDEGEDDDFGDLDENSPLTLHLIRD